MLSEHEFVDCRYVLQKVDAFLDGELTEADADEVRRHLDACEHCLDQADVEATLRKVVRRCRRGVATQGHHHQHQVAT